MTGMLVEPGKPTKTIEAPSAEPSRDPKHNPKSGDVIEDEDWTFTVTSYGLDDKNRKIVRYAAAPSPAQGIVHRDVKPENTIPEQGSLFS